MQDESASGALMAPPSEGVTPDLISSSVSRVPLQAAFQVEPTVTAQYGDVIAARVKSVSPNYPFLEMPGGKEVALEESKVLLGVLGCRRALHGFSGGLPSRLKPAMSLHVLNKGGVIGQCTGFHRDLEWPTEVEYLGTVQRNGQPLNLRDFALPLIEEALPEVPVVMVVGTCMDAGKTSVCKRLLEPLSERGFSINAGKVSGVASQRDLLAMDRHGAKETLSFVDFGFPSTTHLESLVSVARSMVHYLSRSNPDFVLLELGDGIVGSYRVASLFEDEQLMSRCVFTILCANDLMGVWGALQWLTSTGNPKQTVLVSGRVTDSTEGVRFIEKNWNLPAANAFDGAAKICTHVLESMMPWLELE